MNSHLIFYYFCSGDTPPKQVPVGLSPWLSILIPSAVVLVVLILVALAIWLYFRRRKGMNGDTCTCKHDSTYLLSNCMPIYCKHLAVYSI